MQTSYITNHLMASKLVQTNGTVDLLQLTTKLRERATTNPASVNFGDVLHPSILVILCWYCGVNNHISLRTPTPATPATQTKLSGPWDLFGSISCGKRDSKRHNDQSFGRRQLIETPWAAGFDILKGDLKKANTIWCTVYICILYEVYRPLVELVPWSGIGCLTKPWGCMLER